MGTRVRSARFAAWRRNMGAKVETAKAGHPLFYELLDSLEPRFLEKFRELVADMASLHDRKNNNYAEDSDPLSNLKQCAELNIPPLMGVMVRLQDKDSRLVQLMKGKRDLVGESIEDTLMDKAVYSLLAIILMRDAVASGTPEFWINPLRARE